MNKKEPWEMTENEYLAFKEFMDSMEAARMKHKKDIDPVMKIYCEACGLLEERHVHERLRIQEKLDRSIFAFNEEYAATKNAIVKKYEEFKRLLRKSTET